MDGKIETQQDMAKAIKEQLSDDLSFSGMNEYHNTVGLAVDAIKEYFRLIGDHEMASEFVKTSSTSAYKEPKFRSDLNKSLVNFWMLADSLKSNSEFVASTLENFLEPPNMLLASISAQAKVSFTIITPFQRSIGVLEAIDQVMQMRDLVQKERAKVMTRLSSELNLGQGVIGDGDDITRQLLQVYRTLRSIDSDAVSKLNNSLDTVKDAVRNVVSRWIQGEVLLLHMIMAFGDGKCRYFSGMDRPWPKFNRIFEATLQEDAECESDEPEKDNKPLEGSLPLL